MNKPLEKCYILLKNDHYELLPCEKVEFTVEEMRKAINAEILDFPKFSDPMGLICDRFTAGQLHGVVDDIGALDNKEVNQLASVLYDPENSVICGDALLGFDVDFGDGDFEICPIPILFLSDICEKLDRLVYQIAEYKDNISGSDLQLGKYDVEVMNGKGYYNSDGRYIAHSQYDIFGEPIS